MIAVSGERRDGAIPAEACFGGTGVGRSAGRADIRRTGTVHHTALRHTGQSTTPARAVYSVVVEAVAWKTWKSQGINIEKNKIMKTCWSQENYIVFWRFGVEVPV